jgi:hypothetical protein
MSDGDNLKDTPKTPVPSVVILISGSKIIIVRYPTIYDENNN